jgi:hypothetical protein
MKLFTARTELRILVRDRAIVRWLVWVTLTISQIL